MRPNNALRPTPVRGPEIAGNLQSRFVFTAVPIYAAARLNAGRWAALYFLPYQSSWASSASSPRSSINDRDHLMWSLPLHKACDVQYNHIITTELGLSLNKL
jgi:hypothetical protein